MQRKQTNLQANQERYYPITIPTQYRHDQAYQEQPSFLSPPAGKFSLKAQNHMHHPHHRRPHPQHHATQYTEKSTACNSTFSKQSKKSIKNLLLLSRGRNHQSENAISLRYIDIQEKAEKNEKVSSGLFETSSLFQTFFCKTKPASNEMDQEDGCRCRPKCLWTHHWLSLSQRSHRNFSNSNPTVKKTPVSTATREQIKKDIPRTQPKFKTFQNDDYLSMLQQTLMGYASMDEEVGYVQGMNIIASIIVFHGRSSVQCLEIMRFLMMEKDFRQLYVRDFQLGGKLSQTLSNTLRSKCNDLYRHICEIFQIDLRMFFIGWLIPMLGNIIPLDYMHLVINHFLERGWEGIMKIIIATLLFLRNQILALDDETHIMELLSVQGIQNRETGIDWEQIILSSRNVKIMW